MTSAYLALKLFEPDFEEVPIPFDKILDAVQEHAVDAGLVIHEGQLTYGRSGFQNVLDLGRWWKNTPTICRCRWAATCCCVRIPEDLKSECCRLMRESIQYALDHSEESLNYALQFARDLEPRLAEKFVGMYVNHFTVDCGDLVPRGRSEAAGYGL